jgi:phosphoesterase RecJ-like protein
MQKNELSAIEELLKQASHIAITTHQRPDGDAMGSSLGLAHYLRGQGHQVKVVTPTDYPANLKWLPGTEEVIIGPEAPEAQQALQEADLLFCLDFNDLKRIEPLDEPARQAGARVMVDHHMHPADFAEALYWDDEASSTAEMVYRLICERGHADQVTAEIASCLYTGVMTDTGSFRFPSTSAAVHRMVAHLMEAGLKAHEVHEAVYSNDEEKRLRLIGHALSERMIILPEYRTGYILLNKADAAKFDIQSGDTEGLVNYPLGIRNIVFAVFMIEKDDLVKMSFRSRGSFPANEFARQFNGGGHFHAAGGRSTESLATTQEKFLSLLETYKDRLLEV